MPTVTADELTWPSGCHDPDSCSRHKQCMYIRCSHGGEDIASKIEAATSLLAKPRHMTPSCANCRHGVYIEGRGRGSRSIVVCRRNPPLAVHMRGEIYDPGDTLQGFWPRVSPDDVCGEHAFNDGEG